jgi:hypothetical protein
LTGLEDVARDSVRRWSAAVSRGRADAAAALSRIGAAWPAGSAALARVRAAWPEVAAAARETWAEAGAEIGRRSRRRRRRVGHAGDAPAPAAIAAEAPLAEGPRGAAAPPADAPARGRAFRTARLVLGVLWAAATLPVRTAYAIVDWAAATAVTVLDLALAACAAVGLTVLVAGGLAVWIVSDPGRFRAAVVFAVEASAEHGEALARAGASVRSAFGLHPDWPFASDPGPAAGRPAARWSLDAGSPPVAEREAEAGGAAAADDGGAARSPFGVWVPAPVVPGMPER